MVSVLNTNATTQIKTMKNKKKQQIKNEID